MLSNVSSLYISYNSISAVTEKVCLKEVKKPWECWKERMDKSLWGRFTSELNLYAKRKSKYYMSFDSFI